MNVIADFSVEKIIRLIFHFLQNLGNPSLSNKLFEFLIPFKIWLIRIIDVHLNF